MTFKMIRQRLTFPGDGLEMVKPPGVVRITKRDILGHTIRSHFKSDPESGDARQEIGANPARDS